MIALLVAAGAILFYLNRSKPRFSETYELTERGLRIDRLWGNPASVAAVKFGIPREVVIAVIGVESDGNSVAKGLAGEIGLMQLLPSGALADYEKLHGAVFNPFNPVTNIEIGSWFLGQINRNFPLESWLDKVQAYNTGIEGYKNGLRRYAYVERFEKFVSVQRGTGST